MDEELAAAVKACPFQSKPRPWDAPLFRLARMFPQGHPLRDRQRLSDAWIAFHKPDLTKHSRREIISTVGRFLDDADKGKGFALDRLGEQAIEDLKYRPDLFSCIEHLRSDCGPSVFVLAALTRRCWYAAGDEPFRLARVVAADVVARHVPEDERVSEKTIGRWLHGLLTDSGIVRVVDRGKGTVVERDAGGKCHVKERGQAATWEYTGPHPIPAIGGIDDDIPTDLPQVGKLGQAMT